MHLILYKKELKNHKDVAFDILRGTALKKT